MFDYAHNIESMQIEITNMCNAYCPGCARNYGGGELKEFITKGSMKSHVWEKLTTKTNMENIQSIVFNGAFGDPLMHPNILDMLQHLSEVKNNLNINIFSNGSMRNEKFFTELAHKLNQFDSHVLTFSIDGLEDTNHLHRRNTDFKKITKHVQAFNKAGGHSEWWMVLFEHNKHQIVTAKEMAKELGCSRFALRKSYQKEIVAVQHLKFPAGVMVSPDYSEVEKLIDKHNTDFVSKKLTGEVQKTSMAHTIDKMVKRKQCPWTIEKMIQVDHIGNIWPCCYVAEDQLNGASPEWDRTYLTRRHGTFYNNIMIQKDLKTILNGDFFQKYVNEHWMNVDKSPLCKQCLGQ